MIFELNQLNDHDKEMLVYYEEALKDPSITAEQKTEVQTSINKINILFYHIPIM